MEDYARLLTKCAQEDSIKNLKLLLDHEIRSTTIPTPTYPDTK